jgi:hypothetical protein
MSERWQGVHPRFISLVIVGAVLGTGTDAVAQTTYGAVVNRTQESQNLYGPVVLPAPSDGSALLSTAPLSGSARKRCSWPACRTTFLKDRTVQPSLVYPLDRLTTIPSAKMKVDVCPMGMTSGRNCLSFFEEYKTLADGIFERTGTLPQLTSGCWRLVWPDGVLSRPFAVLKYPGERLGVSCFD